MFVLFQVGYYRDQYLDGDDKKYRVTTIAMKPTIFGKAKFVLIIKMKTLPDLDPLHLCQKS